MFELADGGHVEVDGVVGFGSGEAPAPGEKAFIVIDESGQALRWEPYPGVRLRRNPD